MKFFRFIFTSLLVLLPFFFSYAAVPLIINFQGRLYDSSDNLLGGAGTDYCFKFAIYDANTAGTKLWPTGAPNYTTLTVRNGVFDAYIGDTSGGEGDALTFDFESDDDVYVDVQVADKVGATCAAGDGAESYETLDPRPRIVSSGFAINSKTAGTVTGAAQTAITSLGTLTGLSITSANTTQVTTASALALNVNSLTTGTGFYAASSSLTSGSLIDLAITGTAGLTGQKGINVSLSGANATGAQTTYGGYFSNTHTGTSTNVGLYATATGGTNNYAAIFEAGNVGIGTTAPGGKLDVVGSLVTARVETTGSLSLIGTDATASAQTYLTLSTGVGNATGPNIVLSKSRSQSYGAIVLNDPLGTIQFQGGNGSASVEGARIQSLAGSTWSGTNRESSLSFWTTPLNSTTIAERMRIDDSGNVGIGTATPGTKFDVVIDTASGRGIQYNYSTAGLSEVDILSRTSGLMLLNNSLGLAYGSAEAVRITSTGNVGIGTTTPLLKLDVAGSGRFTGAATSVLTGSIDATASTAVVGVGTLFTTELVVGDRITVTGETRTVTAITDATNLTVDTAFTDTANDTSPDKLAAIFLTRLSSNAIGMVQNDLGNVGIGTAAPTKKLEIAGTGTVAGLRLNYVPGTYPTTYLADIYYDAVPGGQEGLVIQSAGSTATNGTIRLNPSGGNVGIGTTAPDKKLEINSATGANLRLTYNDADGSAANYADFSLASTGSLTVAPTGTNPSISLTPGGTGSLLIASGVTTGTTTTSGLSLSANSLTTGTGFYAASSSLSSGALVDLAITGTAGLTNQKGLNISLSGANATGAQTTYGAYLSNTHTGTSTNVGLYATASGGSNNYAGIFEAGNVGIGITNPSVKLAVGQVTNDSVASQSTIGVSTGGKFGSAAAQKIMDLSFIGQFELARIRSIDETATTDGGYLSFWSSVAAGTPLERMRIDRNGNVGIGTTGPDKVLEVNLGTTSALRLTYNDPDGSAANYTDFSVASTGSLTVAPTGTNPSISLTPGGTGSLLIASGVTTGTTTTSALSLSANSLTTGTGFYAASSSLSSGALVDLAITGTAGLTNQKGLNISLSGANATGAQTTYGAYLSNTHTGTSVNVGLYATASGGSTNFAGNFDAGQVLIGGTTLTSGTLSKLNIVSSMASNGSTTAIAGIHGEYTINPSAGGTQVGNRFVINNAPTVTANTAINQIVRSIDNTTLANLVRGLEVVSNAGSNTAGTNTGIRTTGATFGIQALTSGLAGGVALPAAIYGESTGTTQGDILRLYSATITSTPQMAYFYHDTSTFTGTGLLMDFATGSGTFSGNFVDFQNNNVTKFKVTNAGVTSFGLSGTASTTAVCSSLANATAPTAGTAYEIRDCNAAPAADYAEMYPVEDVVEYGDIVVTGTEMVNTYDTTDGNIDWTKVKGEITELVRSSAPYQQNVIGVVSDNYNDFTSAGHNIKEDDNPMPVALNGRVPVKIASSSEEIRPGDYLTTSSEPGKAMKAAESGTVIGKALGFWRTDMGTETVMVFVEQGYYDGTRFATAPGGVPPSAVTSAETPVTGEELLAEQNLRPFDFDVTELFTQGLALGLDAVFGSLSATALRVEALDVSSQANFSGLTFFSSDVEFLGSVTFDEAVMFNTAPTWSKDTAGFARILEGDQSVRVEFETAYAMTPVVTTTLTFEATDNIDDIDAQEIFEANISHLVKDKDETGFTIVLNKPAPYNLRFSWVALGVEGASVFESLGEGLEFLPTSPEASQSEEETEETQTPPDLPLSGEEETVPEEIISEEPVVEEVVPEETVKKEITTPIPPSEATPEDGQGGEEAAPEPAEQGL